MVRPLEDDDFDRPRRRFSYWSLLAPAALVVVLIMLFTAASGSCAVGGCATSKTVAKKTGTTTTKVRMRRHYRIRRGGTAETIAAKFGLSLAQLKHCNPQVFDFYQLQAGGMLNVGAKCHTAGSANT